jgi:hypothetical protein
MTSSSNSFHPAIDSSIRTSVTGLTSSPRDDRVADLAAERDGIGDCRRGIRARYVEPRLIHGSTEAAPVLGAADRM